MVVIYYITTKLSILLLHLFAKKRKLSTNRMECAFPKARTSPPSPKNEPSPLCRCYPYQRRSAVFIYPAFEGLQYLDKCTNNTRRREKFPASLSFLLCKHRETILIGSTENIFFVTMLNHLHIGKKVYNISQPTLVKLGTGKVFSAKYPLDACFPSLSHTLHRQSQHLFPECVLLLRFHSNVHPQGRRRYLQKYIHRCLLQNHLLHQPIPDILLQTDQRYILRRSIQERHFCILTRPYFHEAHKPHPRFAFQIIYLPLPFLPFCLPPPVLSVSGFMIKQ